MRKQIKTLYLDCKMGAAGDMIMAALLGLAEHQKAFIKFMNTLFDGVTVLAETVTRQGVEGLHVSVMIHDTEELSYDALPGETPPDFPKLGQFKRKSDLMDKHSKLRGLPVSDGVKKDAAAILRLLEEAESAVHGKPAEEIHFHPLGTIDALTDIVGVCVLMELLNPDQIITSPINVGSGTIWCPHGMLPVPAPATSYLLQGIPYYSKEVKKELCTPTGAAILKYFSNSYEPAPAMKPIKTSNGFGQKQFAVPSFIRATLVHLNGIAAI